VIADRVAVDVAQDLDELRGRPGPPAAAELLQARLAEDELGPGGHAPSLAVPPQVLGQDDADLAAHGGEIGAPE